jgi:hypothetical protein
VIVNKKKVCVGLMQDNINIKGGGRRTKGVTHDHQRRLDCGTLHPFVKCVFNYSRIKKDDR